jgi:hypothetical protein
MPAIDLPGLDRLLEASRRYGVPMEIGPRSSTPPRAGELLEGLPIDPLLAAAYARVGKLGLGPSRQLLMRCDNEANTLLRENKEWQSYFPHEFWPEHFRPLVIFGGNMLYRYALVPTLANSSGHQPVVFVDPYEEIYALPIASDLNRFFDVSSHYVKILAEDPEYRATGAPSAGFPWRTPELIAKDSHLIEMMKKGIFDRLMYESNKTGRRDETGIAEIQKWLETVLAVAAGPVGAPA